MRAGFRVCRVAPLPNMSDRLATTSDVTVPARTSAAARSADARADASRLGAVLRYLDLILLAVAVPVTLALGAPVVGVVVSAAAWLLQHVVTRVARHWIARQGSNARFGLNLIDAFGRIWLLAGAIVLAAVIGGRSSGLTAALVIFGAYSVAFAVRLVGGRPQGDLER
jgi:hypothetical protein